MMRLKPLYSIILLWSIYCALQSSSFDSPSSSSHTLTTPPSLSAISISSLTPSLFLFSFGQILRTALTDVDRARAAALRTGRLRELASLRRKSLVRRKRRRHRQQLIDAEDGGTHQSTYEDEEDNLTPAPPLVVVKPTGEQELYQPSNVSGKRRIRLPGRRPYRASKRPSRLDGRSEKARSRHQADQKVDSNKQTSSSFPPRRGHIPYHAPTPEEILQQQQAIAAQQPPHDISPYEPHEGIHTDGTTPSQPSPLQSPSTSSSWSPPSSSSSSSSNDPTNDPLNIQPGEVGREFSLEHLTPDQQAALANLDGPQPFTMPYQQQQQQQQQQQMDSPFPHASASDSPSSSRSSMKSDGSASDVGYFTNVVDNMIDSSSSIGRPTNESARGVMIIVVVPLICILIAFIGYSCFIYHKRLALEEKQFTSAKEGINTRRRQNVEEIIRTVDGHNEAHQRGLVDENERRAIGKNSKKPGATKIRHNEDEWEVCVEDDDL